jgi:class 3 adenylate cyclase/tetratricopeptide (TPR) repeat protein
VCDVAACANCGIESGGDAKFCKECGSPLAAAAPPRELRKTVTVLFCDVTGSTALGEGTDPEALRALLARYFQRMKAIVERHGGTVEKFIGDAVMAVFGVPVVHEDDALRACRAAVEMRDALPQLGIRGRIGVNTGEVVTGTAERLATGDAVNVAARLEAAAAPGEVLIGAETRRLVRDAVEVGEPRSLELKGKAEPVTAYPLDGVVGDAPTRRLDAPLVGRRHELRALGDAWGRALADRSCHLFTLLGSAGIGKSRLTAEFLPGVDGARVAVGRCRSYGEGITYSPAIEISAALGRPSDPRAAEAIASLLGESDAVFHADELAWAFRKLVEEAAPAVLVFDDVHWAEPTLLDLIEHVADWSRDAPILLLSLARPELLDRRPTWGGGKLNATTALLEPLAAAETDELIDRLLGAGEVDGALRGRIREAAGGNALYVEEILSMLAESPGADVRVPPTIQALLAARLDQLDPAERAVLECGSVEGQVFHRGGVEALGAARDAPARLMALVRKELVRPEAAQLPGDDAFRFRHLLIRDAAYDSVAKSTRSELHERFAHWLDGRAANLVDFDEISGYHLEQAHRYRVELGLADERTKTLALRAAERLGAAAARAFMRRDMTAAVGLLRRATELAPGRFVDHELALIDALAETDAPREALDVADALAARAAAEGDRLLELRARLARIKASMLVEDTPMEAAAELARQAIPEFERAGDDAGLAAAWLAVGLAEHFVAHFGSSHAALERSLEHARRAGGFALAGSTELWMASHHALGPIPVDEARRWFTEHREAGRAVPALRSFEAVVAASEGDFDRARRLAEEGVALALELGQTLVAAASAMHTAAIELAAGNPERAAEIARDGEAALAAAGENGWRSTVACFAAEALYQLGRDEEAERYADIAEAAGAADDVLTQMLVRQVRAKLLLRRGELAEAERLAREAVRLADTTDAVPFVADARLDLAVVLEAAGRAGEARDAVAAAADLYERKGHAVGLTRARERLAALA